MQILRYADDGLWGRLSALGIRHDPHLGGAVPLATLVGSRFRIREGPTKTTAPVLAAASAAPAA